MNLTRANFIDRSSKTKSTRFCFVSLCNWSRKFTFPYQPIQVRDISYVWNSSNTCHSMIGYVHLVSRHHANVVRSLKSMCIVFTLVLDRTYLSRNVLAFVKMCVLCAFTLVLWYMYVTDGNARGNGKFDGRYTLVPCPFSHIYIVYMPLCVLYGAFHREISRLSSAILGFLLV